MNWNVADLEQISKESEYIDTVVLPLVPITFGDEMKKNASTMEFVSVLTQQIETQFKGRLLMLPNVTYLQEIGKEEKLHLLESWTTAVQKLPFKHIMYVTSDPEWKESKDKLSGKLIWIPAIPLEDMDEKYKRSIMEDQVKSLLKIFIEVWQRT
ncbi:YpiF family protein [Bacillus sp. 2205SS5-2]|uniref:YpiF family protein n=1 Tax=Bacillus sp. 2205SS5-2 TaxID=3109031 RepID=UPI003007AA5B